MYIFIDILKNINLIINQIIWGPIMVCLLFLCGLYLTFGTNFYQIRKFKYIFIKTLGSIFIKKNLKNEISPFQAMTTALAGTVGTGNIVGSATAIALGGPGALFWIVVCAFFGMMTKYTEIFLSIKYRVTLKNGKKAGGPMYYMKIGLNNNILPICFSFFALFASFGIGNIAQINSLSNAIYNCFKVDKLYTGIIISMLIGSIIIKGDKKIAKTTEKIIPIMSIFYISICIFVLYKNYNNLLNSFMIILKHAFTPTAAFGGFAGSTILTTIRHGMSKGMFSNEAGLGSSPIAHAMSSCNKPKEQANWGIFEVFIDTIVVCTLTGLVIISSNTWQSGLIGADLTIKAFSTGIGILSPYFISISILFFSFSSMISWSYYGEKCLEFILNTSKYNNIYKIIFLIIIIIGSNSDLLTVWSISDTLNGFMAIPNLIAILFLSKHVFTSCTN